MSVSSPLMRHSGGFTLIEVMIALVIFTVALLGLAGLQAASLRDNQLAYLNTVATQLAHDMGERIRANPAAAAAGAYLVDNVNGSVAGCRPSRRDSPPARGEFQPLGGCCR